ncbi:MAG: EamA family transporter RarD [Candidatus Eremiobacteraeota bacterium]|nr:EamA family transporter RarD [Candidatus Eremiobacteraeota bacterium]MCW5868836.1 EamA family transporter RarD [Candidatus Eremiobacteraeota bacterium]
MRGVLYGVATYFSWGVLPLYFHLLDDLPPLAILAHRVLWCLLFLLAWLAFQGELANYSRRAADPKLLRWLIPSGLLIGTNWYLFVFAVSQHRVTEVALAYYISPLISALWGLLFLREHLSQLQLSSLLLAALGVAYLALNAGGVPWMALAIAVSFATYSFLRKRAGVDSMLGLWIETLVLSGPAAVLAIACTPAQANWGLLALSGPLTGIPLLCFGVAARHLRLVTLGLLQYISPTLQFLVAVAAFEEPFGKDHAVAFICIWGAVALYSASALGRKFPAPASKI